MIDERCAQRLWLAGWIELNIGTTLLLRQYHYYYYTIITATLIMAAGAVSVAPVATATDAAASRRAPRASGMHMRGLVSCKIDNSNSNRSGRAR